MTTWTYRMDHDLGFAPNPFFGWCTLACCKPRIRKHAEIGDVVVGMAGSGSRGLGAIHPQIVYWMRVGTALDFDAYWRDPRFAMKRPVMPGPRIAMVGDRTYRRDAGGADWLFEHSMHNTPGSTVGEAHRLVDTGVDRILIGSEFTYWGGSGPVLPDELKRVFPNPRGEKRNHEPKMERALLAFIEVDRPSGLLGRPFDWSNSRYFS